MSTCGTVAQHTVHVGKFDMVSAAIKQRLSSVECVERVLIGKCVRSRAVRTGTETPHGVAAYPVPVSLERSQSRFGKHIAGRKRCQPLAFRQRFVTLQTEPCKVYSGSTFRVRRTKSAAYVFPVRRASASKYPIRILLGRPTF